MIGDRKAVQALSYATGDHDVEVRSTAIFALGLMQDEQAVDEIVAALDDSSFDVRYDAVWALGQIGEPDAEEQLRGFYERNRSWQQSPQLTFDEGRLRRQVEIRQEVYLTLRREYETARVET